MSPSGFEEMWADLAPVGRHAATGGYRRHTYTPAELECRAWFTQAAAERGMPAGADHNGNLWAWWGSPGPGAVVTGSHLDSVPDGGAYDGPLGVVSAFAAVDALRAKGFAPRRPIAVVAFAEEEGGRFGVACLGSRLLTGGIDPTRARALTDERGTSLADAMAAAGLDADVIGRDDEALSRIGVYVELHVEQGRAQADLDAPVAVGASIWPHGRWRLEFAGSANHAGTTRIDDRQDPMLTYANTVLAARKKARLAGALATVGKVLCEPNGANAIPSRVLAWLDARAASEETLAEVVDEIEQASVARAERDSTRLTVTRESYSGEVTFDRALAERLVALVGVPDRPAPLLATGAGHDAGVLAAHVPTAMLFVRNPTGISHSPEEHAELADCLAGADALAAVLEDLAA
ncbi:MAG: allantoate amidohydrolase [Micromonosporaceae bacterium]|nr:allantoate amidohydrolase [Micromonosporaceae bacterium]